MLRGFIHTMPKASKAAASKAKAAQSPLQPYVVYDLILRSSMVAGLGLIALAAMRETDQ